MCITIVAIWHHRDYKRNSSLMQFCLILDIALTFTMAAFSIWNWFLALLGKTSIEFWTDFGWSGENKAKLHFDSFNDNLFRIFGTHNIIRVLSPSLRNVPFTGLEWSYMLKDDGYDCNGNKLSVHDQENKGYGRVAEEEDEDDEEVEMVLIHVKPFKLLITSLMKVERMGLKVSTHL